MELGEASRDSTGFAAMEEGINNLRYADDTTFMAESEEELKSPLMKVKEESEEFGLPPRPRGSPRCGSGFGYDVLCPDAECSVLQGSLGVCSRDRYLLAYSRRKPGARTSVLALR